MMRSALLLAHDCNGVESVEYAEQVRVLNEIQRLPDESIPAGCPVGRCSDARLSVWPFVVNFETFARVHRTAVTGRQRSPVGLPGRRQTCAIAGFDMITASRSVQGWRSS